MLHTVWNVSGQEPSIGVGQEVVNCVTFYPMPPAGKDFALTILGFLLGTAVATILGFFYGSADKHNGKR